MMSRRRRRNRSRDIRFRPPPRGTQGKGMRTAPGMSFAKGRVASQYQAKADS